MYHSKISYVAQKEKYAKIWSLTAFSSMWEFSSVEHQITQVMLKYCSALTEMRCADQDVRWDLRPARKQQILSVIHTEP